MSDYWQGFWQRRSTRRMVLRGVAVTGAAVVAGKLAGCTGGKQTSEPIKAIGAEDTSSRATPGGIFKGGPRYYEDDIATMDVLATTSSKSQILAGWTHSRLLKFKPGVGKKADGSVEGDAAESWEVPDPLTIVFKLRPNVKWDPRAPTNSRPMDAEDVVFSWEKFKAVSINRTDLVNALSSDAPIDSITARDKQTVVVKLAKSNSSIFSLLASGAHFWIMPRESDGGYDPNKMTRGSGPWLLESYKPNVAFHYKKNPNWYVSGRPFIDEWEVPVILEAVQLRAQFGAKNIWVYDYQEDMLDVKRDFPETILGKLPQSAGNRTIIYGFNPGSPFLEKKVRQAVSMAIDRDSLIETIYDIKRFKEAGLEKVYGWGTAISAGWGDIWLDPNGSEFGPNAKYYQYNPEGAKKLLAEAGYPGGFDTQFIYIPTSQYGLEFPKIAQILIEMLNAVGIRAKAKPVDYNTEWLPKYHQARGKFDGMALHTHGQHADPAVWLFLFYHSKGGRTHAAAGIDPQTDKYIDSLFAEYNEAKRKSIFYELQRHIADTQVETPVSAEPERLKLAWPMVQNFAVFNPWPGGGNYGPPCEVITNWWIDKTKMST